MAVCEAVTSYRENIAVLDKSIEEYQRRMIIFDTESNARLLKLGERWLDEIEVEFRGFMENFETGLDDYVDLVLDERAGIPGARKTRETVDELVSDFNTTERQGNGAVVGFENFARGFEVCLDDYVGLVLGERAGVPGARIIRETVDELVSDFNTILADNWVAR